MFRKASLLVLTLLLSSTIMLNTCISAQLGTPFIKTVIASPNELYVNPGESIQAAINNASAGDTILVSSGTYHEHLIVNKSLTLKGAGSDTTFIDGDGENEPIISISASDVEVSGFTIQNGSKTQESGGIQTWFAVDVTIHNNVITKSYFGIFLSVSNSCNVVDNVITDNYFCGIKISDSSYNNIVGNTIRNDSKGILIPSDGSQSNVFYHNNFIGNPTQVSSYATTTIWDNGAEGNYWSDYGGVDSDGDGIGDTRYTGDFGWDEYPLIEPWSIFRVHVVPWNGQNYTVTTYCNSTVASFNFNQPEKQINFNVTGPSAKVVFCNVTIPKALLNASSSSWAIFLDDTNVTDTISVTENATHTSTYLTFWFSSSTQKVTIIGTDVVPEFSTTLLFLTFLFLTLTTIILVKKRNRRHYGQRFRANAQESFS